MINELDVVVLRRELKEYGLEKGHRGAVVHCYADGIGFEVEFIEPPHVLTLTSADIKLDISVLKEQVTAIMDNLPEEAASEVRDFAESLHQKYAVKVS